MTAAVLRAPVANDREFHFDDADFQRIATLAYAEAGIVLPPRKAQLVYARLAPLVRASGLTQVGEFLTLIAHDADERARTIDALTTNHTSFWREAHHFEDFAARPWPGLVERLQRGGRVRLWSAACSSGEEPYSWLMAALGQDRRVGLDLLRRDLKLLATDLSPTVLDAARAGTYPVAALARLPVGLRNAWVARDGATATVDPRLQAAIAFRQLNLIQDWPIRGTFDAIFCRNVMIYFDAPTKARLQSRLADRLVDGGMLYLGHSERLEPAVADRLRYVGRTAFQKVAA